MNSAMFWKVRQMPAKAARFRIGPGDVLAAIDERGFGRLVTAVK